MKTTFDSVGIQIDLPRLEKFMSDYSYTVPWLAGSLGKGVVSQGRMYSSSSDPPPNTEPPCQLVFLEPGMVSKVSSVELKTINPQGPPAEWLKELDALQCAVCQRALAAKLNQAGAAGINGMRQAALELMVPMEYQLVKDHLPKE